MPGAIRRGSAILTVLVSIIECVPNLSEGRRPEVMSALAAAAKVDGVALLDVSSDPDHNRIVLTMAGDDPALQTAVSALIEAAVSTIDLTAHTGVHPRMGAVDVVPFVPLRGTSMEACVTLARKVAQEIAERCSIPSFLYGEAATTPERHRLERIRQASCAQRGGMIAAPDGAPDFGPLTPHPTAGVAAIGARPLLVAYNVELASGGLEAARAIASAVRERDGGLPGVKALGLMLAGRAVPQVSMNLVDLDRTSIRDAYDTVVREAERLGTEVSVSEIVGLAPRKVLAQEDAEHVRLRVGDRLPVLEDRLTEAGLIAAGATL